jgi:hypothetical protein
MSFTIDYQQMIQDAGNYQQAGISKLKSQDQADSIREGMRMRDINRQQAELGLEQQRQSMAQQQADFNARRNPDGSIKSDADYTESLKEREGNFNDQIAQRGWQLRQDYAEQQRQKVNNEQRSNATALAQQRMGRRVNVSLPTAS